MSVTQVTEQRLRPWHLCNRCSVRIRKSFSQRPAVSSPAGQRLKPRLTKHEVALRRQSILSAEADVVFCQPRIYSPGRCQGCQRKEESTLSKTGLTFGNSAGNAVKVTI
jgi:hypothetical protein